MKISKFFFSVIVVTSSVVFAGKKNGQDRCTELTTYYDSTTDEDKKLTIWNLDDQYTSHVLRKIVYKTFDHGTLPSNAMNIFNQLLNFPPNFIFLPQVLNRQISEVLSTSNPDISKVKALILTSVQIGCVKKNQQYHQIQLAKETKQLTELQLQLKKLENNNPDE